MLRREEGEKERGSRLTLDALPAASYSLGICQLSANYLLAVRQLAAGRGAYFFSSGSTCCSYAVRAASITLCMS